MTSELPNHNVLAAHGYVIAYNKSRNKRVVGAELLHMAFPGLFVDADEGVWCHAAGNTLILSLRRAVNAISKWSQIKDAKKLAIQRELIAAIKVDFTENALHALVESLGKDEAATTIAERALWRRELLRNGKLPPGEMK